MVEIELRHLIGEANAGNRAAFSELARRYEDMAFGYALSIVRDFHLAQDVAQEALLSAYFSLARLQEPDAFPGWLKGIVRHHCGRILRKRHFDLVPLQDASELVSKAPGVDEHAEREEMLTNVLAAIDTLPQTQREVVILFYLREYSQQEVAAFLEVPVTTVNNRLHVARQQLKRRFEPMIRETREQDARLDRDVHIGEVIAVDGIVVQTRFQPGHTPALLDVLHLANGSKSPALALEVVQHVSDGVVRALARSTSPGLRVGAKVTGTGAAVETGLDPVLLPQTIAALGGTGAEAGERPHVLETGIKALDLLCPLPRRGMAGALGDMGTGKLVVIEELARNIAGRDEGLMLWTFIEPGTDAAFLREYSPRGANTGSLNVLYISSNDPLATDPGLFDATIYTSRERAVTQLWPAIDPLRSTSRLLTPEIVGQHHYDVAQGVRTLLQQAKEIEAVRSGGELEEHDRLIVARARKIERFLTQFFFVAEEYTKRPGQYVGLDETVDGFAAILAGEYDDVPEAALLYRGGIASVMEQAQEPQT
ncbi:MAG TPA: sigma-70 family RNA polymerase sigma factor [Herpetosiphonaceae bacterium]|nr:sigma-70 family RNA polymerase sigma factor [Herpetosiphonaceae bacterium]